MFNTIRGENYTLVFDPAVWKDIMVATTISRIFRDFPMKNRVLKGDFQRNDTTKLIFEKKFVLLDTKHVSTRHNDWGIFCHCFLKNFKDPEHIKECCNHYNILCPAQRFQVNSDTSISFLPNHGLCAVDALPLSGFCPCLFSAPLCFFSLPFLGPGPELTYLGL